MNMGDVLRTRATDADAPSLSSTSLGHSVGIAIAMNAAWDEAAERLRQKDDAGFDAAMRIFWKVSNTGRSAAQEAAPKYNG
jgi:hypothetical protein